MSAIKLTIFTMMMLTLTFVSGTTSSFSSAGKTEVVIPVEDLEKYPDVKAYIINNGLGNTLKNESQTYEDLVKRYQLFETEPARSIEGMDPEVVKSIEEYYGLDRPKPKIVQYDQYIVVDRFDDGRIRGAWLVTCIANRSSARIDVTSVGDTPQFDNAQEISQTYPLDGGRGIGCDIGVSFTSDHDTP